MVLIISDSPENLQADSSIEIIHSVLGNPIRTYNTQETYVYDAYPCMGVLASAAFAVRSTYRRNKGKIPGQMVFRTRHDTPD